MSPAHLARLHGRLIEVRAREDVQLQTLAFTRTEAEAIEAELVYLSRGTGPAADWNDAHPTGSPVVYLQVRTITRSPAWITEDGQAVVMVRGYTLPVPLAEVTAGEVVSV